MLLAASPSVSTNYNMDQQGKYTEAEILDLSENCQDFDWDSSTWLSSMLDSQKVNTIENHTRRKRHQVSAEELKIRSELEMKIERDLEEEIKESIYHLALRLHRIYQQRKEKTEPGNEVDNRTRTLSEVNISIRMEGGGTKIEIKEVNKEAAERSFPCPRTYRTENVKEVNAFSAKKFDWVKTLRAGSSPVSFNRSKHKMVSTDPNVFSKCKFDGTRGKNASADKMLLQLGWKV